MRYSYKLMVAVILTLVLSMTLIGVSCSQSSSPPSATGAPSSSTSVPVSNVINLKYNNQNPADGYGATHATIPWLNSIQDATKGQVKITPYFSETLAKAANSWQAVLSGVTDMGWVAQSVTTSMHPLGDFSVLPALPYKSSQQATGIFWQLMDKFPSLKNEFKDVKVLNFVVSNPYFLITIKKQIKTIDDMKGMKLRVGGGPPTTFMTSIGVAPMVVGMPDVYMDLQKGVLDGMATNWEALQSFRQYEVVKYYTYYPTYSGYFVEIMNWDTWNKLPPDVQKAIDSVSGMKVSQAMSQNFYASTEIGEAAVKKGNYPMEEYTPTSAELQKWIDTAKPVYDQWLKDMAAKGYTDAPAILSTAQNLINTYNP